MFDFGNHLRMLREKHGISQEELGRRVGRAGSVISNYENNIKNPHAGCPHHYGKDLRCFVRLLGWV